MIGRTREAMWGLELALRPWPHDRVVVRHSLVVGPSLGSALWMGYLGRIRAHWWEVTWFIPRSWAMCVRTLLLWMIAWLVRPRLVWTLWSSWIAKPVPRVHVWPVAMREVGRWRRTMLHGAHERTMGRLLWVALVGRHGSLAGWKRTLLGVSMWGSPVGHSWVAMVPGTGAGATVKLGVGTMGRIVLEARLRYVARHAGVAIVGLGVRGEAALVATGRHLAPHCKVPHTLKGVHAVSPGFSWSALHCHFILNNHALSYFRLYNTNRGILFVPC